MKVYLIHVSHRHGSNIYLNATEAGARRELLEYVKECWGEVFDEEGFAGDDGTDTGWKPKKNFDPGRPDDMIAAYFENNDEEFIEEEGWQEVGP